MEGGDFLTFPYADDGMNAVQQKKLQLSLNHFVTSLLE